MPRPVRRLHDLEPLRRRALGDPDELPHAVREDLGAAPGIESSPAAISRRGRLARAAASRPSGDVLDLGRREGVDGGSSGSVAASSGRAPRRTRSRGRGGARPGAGSAVPPRAIVSSIFSPSSLVREDVALLRPAVAVEGAERAPVDADVRVVDVAVDDVGHDRGIVLAIADLVGGGAQREEISLLEERHGVGRGQTFAPESPVEDRGGAAGASHAPHSIRRGSLFSFDSRR